MRLLKNNHQVVAICLLFALGSPVAHAQTSLLTSRVTETAVDSGMVVRSVEYYDGMGRLSQTVLCGHTPQHQDLVTLHEYDDGGNPSAEWNATPMTATGNRVALSSLTSAAETFYDDGRPYLSILYDGSPLNRVAGKHGGGEQWVASSVAYRVNSTSGVLKCRKYNINGDALKLSGSYAAGELDVVQTTDENGLVTYVFTDMTGLKLLERRVLDSGTNADTYYVYDAIGQLRYVLPPLASTSLTSNNSTWTLSGSATLRKYAYYYAYDGKGRRITSKRPGCSSIEMAYDRDGRLMLTQDGEQSGQGLYTLYAYVDGDKLAMTALVNDSRDIATMRSVCLRREAIAIHANSNQPGLYCLSTSGQNSSNTINLSPDSVLCCNCFGEYTILSKFAADTDSLQYIEMSGYDRLFRVTGKASVQPGRLTGQAVRVLNGDGTLGELLPRVFYYDEHGNVIQTRERNALGGYDVTYRKLTRSGLPLKEMHVHSRTGAATSVDVITNTLDHTGRVTATAMGHSGSTEQIQSLEYDEAGRLHRLELLDDAEKLTYTYDVRSDLTKIQTDYDSFYQQLSRYDSSLGHNVGRITQQKWRNTALQSKATYDYAYDGLGRLTSATYVSPQYYNYDYTCGYGYNLNGNVTSVTRNGVTSRVGSANYFGTIDNLTLTYDGNKLKKVSDTASTLTYANAMDFVDGADKTTEYSYDADGRMTQDKNRKIYEIKYNAIGLPRFVHFEDGHLAYYDYTADGVKIRATYAFNQLMVMANPIVSPESPMGPASLDRLAETMTYGDGAAALDRSPSETVLSLRDYSANHVYLNGELERVLTPIGHIDSLGVHHAYVKDYRGDVRAVVTERDGVVETNDYYPYGMVMCLPWSDMWAQPYKFMGKELDRENGWDSYDVHARWLTSSIAQWTTPDPLAETTPWLSPYSYCGGDPVNFVDNDGMRFTETSWDFLNRYISDIDKRQENNNAEIEKQRNRLSNDNLKVKDVSKINNKIKKLQDQNAELEKARAEIGVLEGSSQVYDIFYDFSRNSIDRFGNVNSISSVGFNVSNGYVEISLGDNYIYSIAHELKHAFQFEMGAYSVGRNTAGAPFYDLTDEKDAYSRGRLFGGPVFEKSFYHNIQKGPASVYDLGPIALSHEDYILRYARHFKTVFRYNGVTYNGLKELKR